MRNLRLLPSLPSMLTGALALMLFSGCGDRRADVPVLLQKSVAAGQNGDWKEAEKQALDALKCNPQEPYALLLSAIAAERLGDAETALANARTAAELAPEDYAANYTYGRMLAKRDLAKEAMVPLERALRARPGDCNALILLGECASVLNDDRAIDYFNALPLKMRGMPEIQTRIAIYYLDRRTTGNGAENLRKASTALSNAWNAAQQNPQVVLNMALFFDHYTKNQKQTVAFYQSYLYLTTRNPELNSTRAQVQARLTALQEKGTRNNRRR